MADRNQLKVADHHHGIADDDPFAELTRIMGFDPRQPVKPQEPQQAVPAEAADDVFDIDLEKELMGGLDAFDEEPVAAAEPAPAIQAGPAPQAQWLAAPEEDAAGDAADADSGFDTATDDAVAASAEQDASFEDELGAFEIGAYEDDVPAQEAATEAVADEPAAEDAYAAPEPRFDGVMDEAVGRELADEYAFDGPADEDSAGEPPHDAVAESEAYTAAAVADEETADADAPVAGSTDDDFSAYFDDAMADVDMDFTSRLTPVDAAAPVAETAEEPVAEEDDFEFDEDVFSTSEEETAEAPAYEHVAGEPAVETDAEGPGFDAADQEADARFQPYEEADGHEDADRAVYEGTADEVVADAGFEDTFDDAFAPEATAETEHPVAAASAEPIVAAEPQQPAGQHENTLEDELNALLNRMTARPVIPDPMEPSAPAASAAGLSHEDSDAAAEAAQSSHDAHGDLDAALVADLEALDLDDFADEPAEAPVDQPTAESRQGDAWQESRSAVDSNWTWTRGTPLAAQPVDATATTAQAAAPAAVEEPVATRPAAPAYTQPAYTHEAAWTAPAVPAAANEMPDVETVDVPERVVALADDLDLPELAFEQDQPESASYDDLDTEFASLLSDMNGAEAAPAAPETDIGRDDRYGGYTLAHGAVQDYPAAAAAAASAAIPAQAYGPADPDDGRSFAAGNAPGADDLDYDPDLDEANTVPSYADSNAQPRNRGLLVAAVIGAVAIAGGLGAFALSLGGSGSSEAPAIVKADNQPIKVKPENPGGTVIPNQDNKVYDAVSKGTKAAEPTQQKLVTDAEEPMDVTAAAPASRVVDLSQAGQDAVPAPKGEDRIEQAVAPQANASANEETALVTPRKVRTMVVKPDGSLVPREDPAPASVAAAEPTDPAPQHVETAGDRTGAVPSATEEKPATAAPAGQSSITPAVAPVAPQRPSDQPVDVVGEVKPQQVAAIDQGSAAGSWSMQIASQPTAESAQKTYQDLARRYSSVLAGRDANIVKAEIAGKGTFYRVRVPAKSRDEAVELCTSYKAAGGNCFVSK